jgi:GT2 family glycosyltransferase
MISDSVVAVIVTYNRLEKLSQAMSNVLAEAFDRVVVFNNGSTDGTDAWLSGLDDARVHVVNSDTNLGGAGGFHAGIDVAVREYMPDWVVCFDDDAYPERGAIDEFRALELDESVAGVAAAVYLPDGTISEMNRPSRNPFASLRTFIKTAVFRRKGFHVTNSDYAGSRMKEIDASSFVGCFIRVKAIEERLGLPRKELFIYGDDILYTLRIGQHGYRHLFAPSVKFVHACETLYEQKDVYLPMWKVYYTYRNRIEIYRTVAGGLFLPIVAVKSLGWLAAIKYYDNKSVYLKLLSLAVRDGLKQDFTKQFAQIRAIAEGR